jgi:hypothetical protein
MSGLPFTAAVWENLPTKLTKLVLDLGEPVRLDQDGNVLHKSYITANEMKPLLEFVKLKELPLFQVRDSLQPLVWETVFRHRSEDAMRVLDIQMAAAPIVRPEQWRRAKNVAGLTVPTEESEEKEYKGKPRQSGYFSGSPLQTSSTVAYSTFDEMSNISIRGSEVPTPTIASSATAGSPAMSAIDGCEISPSTSFGEDQTDASSVDPAASDTTSNMATAGSSSVGSENEPPAKSTLTQKVRQSLLRLSGSAFTL